MKYLSSEGLAHLSAKLKAIFAPIEHTHPSASSTALGLAKLYDAAGSATDGAMTQRATMEAIQQSSGDAAKLIGNILYPVGSIYMNTDSEAAKEPAQIFGGTWTEISGRFLVSKGGSFPTLGATGGATSASASIGNHQHLMPVGTRSNNTVAIVGTDWGTATSQSMSGSKAYWTSTTNSGSFSDIIKPYSSSAGAATVSVSTLPPYMVVRMWKRTGLYVA